MGDGKDRISSDVLASMSEEDIKKPSFCARVVSGSVGSIVTALAVTPLDVVKTRFQTSSIVQSSSALSSASAGLQQQLPSNVSLCPRGCGTFILNNGLSECVLPKSAVPYFDRFGRLIDFTATSTATTTSASTVSMNNGGVQSCDSFANTSKMTKPSSAGGVGRQHKNPRGTFGMLRSIFVKEGFRGIYAGLSPTLVMSVPNTVFYFTAYDEIITRFRNTAAQHQHGRGHHSGDVDKAWFPLVAGASARLLATLVISPLELIRTRQASMVGRSQTQQPIPGLWAELKTIVDSEGFLALYRGLTPTLWRDVPFSAIYWFCLENLRKNLWEPQKGDDRAMWAPPTPLQHFGHEFINGAIAGMIAAACTTPFDVVKTRKQMVEVATESASAVAVEDVFCKHDGAPVYRTVVPSSGSSTISLVCDNHAINRAASSSTFSVMHGIFENEGLSGLWRGNQTRMIKVAPACAIMISCYEFGKRAME